MSWSNFEEFKKFARKSGNVKKKRPTSSVGWQNPPGRKRQQTNNDSLCFVSNSESVSEIEGFSTDEERDDELLDSDSDSTFCMSRNLSKPCVKRKYSKWKTLLDKRGSVPGDGSISHTDTASKEKEVQDYRHSDFIPDGAYELLQCSKTSSGDEIVWCASDEEELPGSVLCDGPESHGTAYSQEKFSLKNTKQGEVMTSRILNSIQPERTTPVIREEAISDFESDQGNSEESQSADISTPTPTPVSPVVVGTPKTASDWLKQVQQKSPQKSEEEQSPEGRGVGMNCDSAKKKRKFVRSGRAQQLQHIISRENSEKAFWNHRVTDTEKNQMSTSFQTDGCLVVQIISDQLQGSVHLTQCLLCNDDTNLPRKLLFVLFTCETWKQFAMHVGSIVNIHPPWQRLDIAGCPWPVLLCTYFCEAQLTPQDHLTAVNLQSLKDGLFIPLMHESTSSQLHQSPKKDFKPSKLLFDNSEGESTEQKTTAVSSLHAVQPVQTARPGYNSCKPDTSILNAIECSGGCSGVLVTFQCVVQRVYCKKAKLSTDINKTYRCSLLNQQLKSQAKSVTEIGNKEVRWTLLVQDVHGMCAEIQVPRHFQDSPDWQSCIANGEGQVYIFSNVRVTQRTNRIRSAGLFSVIQSLWCSSGDYTDKQDSRDSQILTQESESQETSSSCPPDFCYVVSVQESSHASLCQETNDCTDNRRTLGLLYKPYAVTTLKDVLQDKATQRINTFCKLLYCRFIGSSIADDVGNSSFELFVTDSSLQNATQFVGRSEGSLPYVKIMGKSCHMLPPELRQVRTNYGMNLSAKLLLLKAPASHELVADSYCVIRKAVSQSAANAHSAFHEENIQGNIPDSLYSLKTACLPSLTLHSCLGYIYLVEGVVTGVDEETACCWLVCDKCGNADITVQHEANSQFFCSSCDRIVEFPQTRTHLAVLAEVNSVPDAQVKIKLQQSTVDKLLPVSYQDSDQGYDIEAVLGKQLGRMSCYITELSKQQNGSLARTSFTLEEIQIQ